MKISMSYPGVLCLHRPCLIPLMPGDGKHPFSFDAPAIPHKLAPLTKQRNWHMMHAAIQSQRQGKLYITSLFTWKTNINGTVPLLGLWGQIKCQRKRPLTTQQYTNTCQHHQATDKLGDTEVDSLVQWPEYLGLHDLWHWSVKWDDSYL